MIDEKYRLELRLCDLRKEVNKLEEQVRQSKEGMKRYETAWLDQNKRNIALNEVNIALRNENNRLRKLLALKVTDLNGSAVWDQYKISKQEILTTTTSGRKITVK